MTETATPGFVHIFPKQAAFRQSAAQVRGFSGGVGSGKTRIGALDLIKRAVGGRHYMVLGPTYTEMRDASWRTFMEVARLTGKLVSFKGSSPMECRIATSDGGEATVLFRSADNPEMLRGPNLSGIWIDEASLVDEEAYLIALGRLREGGELGWLSMTFTPKGKRHWTYKAFYRVEHGEEYPVADTELVKVHTRENIFVQEDFYKKLLQRYSSRVARQEVAGEFIDLGGSMIDPAWFGEPLQTVPACIKYVRSWDKAGTAREELRRKRRSGRLSEDVKNAAAYTAGVLMGRTADGKFPVIDVVRGQWSALDRENVIKQTAYNDLERYGEGVLTVVEQEGGSGGKESSQATIRNLAGFAVREFRPGSVGDKEKRAEPFVAQVEARNVPLVQASWNADYVEELAEFPDGKLKDQMDASSQAFIFLSRQDVGITLDREIVVSGFSEPRKTAREMLEQEAGKEPWTAEGYQRGREAEIRRLAEAIDGDA